MSITQKGPTSPLQAVSAGSEVMQQNQQSPAKRTVRREADKARKATEARDAAICEMHNEGSTLRAIAEVADMTHAGVARVLKRRSSVVIAKD